MAQHLTLDAYAAGANNWGLGPLGQWHNYSTLTEYMQGQPNPTQVDAQAWTDGTHGNMAYDDASDNPVQGLFLTNPATTDPAGAGSISLPLDVAYKVNWSPGAPNCYLQLYIGPAHHYDLNAWIGLTIQWYGLNNPDELYGMECDVGGQGWAIWPIAPDAMFGSSWFQPFVGMTLAEPQTYGVLVRIHVDGTGYFARAWIDDGRAEPETWAIRVYWDPADPDTARIADYVRVMYFEQQVDDEIVRVDWVQIGSDNVNVLKGDVDRAAES